MPSGLVALLDDVAVIARAAAASLDDVAAGVAKAGTKAAGVVIDDAAVTPSYVTNFTPDRELPVIWKIAKGSLFNKLVILLPVALLLSAFLPWAITPLLMLGGLFLCFEGAEKVIEKLSGTKHGETLEDQPTDVAAFEKSRIAGAVRTDLILSAEIMAIALAEVADQTFVGRAIILALVGVVITLMVYGAVGLLVKMDDIGLHLAKKPSAAAQSTGRMLLKAMPKVLLLISVVGTAAMLWVGGDIIQHNLAVLGVPGPEHVVHAVQHAVGEATGSLAGVLGWLAKAVMCAILGLVLGSIVALVVHLVAKARGKAH
jgi:predicted DNA repair protein MutK